MNLITRLSLMICLGAAGAIAGPVGYMINFTVDSGIAPTAGSFTYDSTASPGSQFSGFTVIFDGYTFDLTASANSPHFADPDGLCSGDVFNFLETGAACTTHDIYFQGTPFPVWVGYDDGVGPSAQFVFEDQAPQQGNNVDYLAIRELLPISTGGSAEGDGLWTISASTPEPASLTLMLAGGTLLLLFRKKWSPHPKCPRSTDQAHHALPSPR